MSKKKVLLRGVFINRDTNGEGVLKVGTTLIRVSTVMGILYIDRRFHLSVAISKDENISKSNNDLKADYTCIFVKYALKRNLHKNRFLK